jgi:alpha-galactosidase
MSAIGFGTWDKTKWNVPGHYNDPDYILIGDIWWQGAIRPTPLTANEQYTYVSLWSLLACPLIFSGDMRKLDDFTLNVLCNDEVIAVNQDPLCRSARRVFKDDLIEVWSKELEDGSRAVGLFNRHEAPVRVTAKWPDIGVSGPCYVRDLWRQKTIGKYDGSFSANVARHGVLFVRVFPVRKP